MSHQRRRQWQPTPVLLPGKSHGQRSLVGCSPWGRKESDTTERLRFHFSLSCIREGNGNPLQCSCLENPRDGGAWWAAVYGVAQSWTCLKRLSSSSSSMSHQKYFPILFYHLFLPYKLPCPHLFFSQNESFFTLSNCISCTQSSIPHTYTHTHMHTEHSQSVGTVYCIVQIIYPRIQVMSSCITRTEKS